LGASLSIGSAGQVLKVNSGASALEFGAVEAILNIDGMTDGSGITIADSDKFAASDGGTEKYILASQIKTYVHGTGAVDITALDIDGGTDIGAAIVAADLFVVDDGAGGTNRKTAASRIKTFVEASAMAVTGNVTATGTVEPAGDTASGDNAAIGYTSAEGLILTGQGSTNDITIKNDADAVVISIPTGTTNVTVAGDLTISGDDLTMGTNTSGAALIADGTNFNPVVISGDISISTAGVAAIGSGVIVAADIASSAITTAKINADAVTSAKIADDAIDSEHYAAGSIDTAHIADDQVTLAKMAGLARGKIIYGNSSGNPTALTVGSSDQILTADGTDLSWSDPSSGGGSYFLGGASGASGDTTNGLEDIFRINSATADTSCTIASGTNASAAGPLTVSSGVTITVGGLLAVLDSIIIVGTIDVSGDLVVL